MSAIDDYLETIPAPQRRELERVRKIVIQAVPKAEEAISYGMPGFKYQGKYLIGYASFTDHLSLFPTGGPIEAMKKELVNFKLAKGTIQFTVDNPIPEATIQELVNIRLIAIAKS